MKITILPINFLFDIKNYLVQVYHKNLNIKATTIVSILVLIFAINIFSMIDYGNKVKNSYNNYSKETSDSAGEECKYINRLVGKKKSYNCCGYSGIKCENNHITEM